MSDSKGSRRPPRPATVLAAIAVFAALAGTATAASSLIKGSQIKKGTITGKQIKNKSLTASKLSADALRQLKGNAGPAGPKGETGPQGPAGIVAPLSGEGGSVNIGDGEEKTVLTVPVATAGKFAITAKTNLFAVQATVDVDCVLIADGQGVDLVQWNVDGANTRQSLAMVALATASPAKPIQVVCAFDEGNGSASETHVVAIPVS